MQITRQADYAMRAMLHLARLPENQKASTSQIAKKEQIPPSFLAKIISQLSIAGLIHTSRGTHGGVTLARPSSDISVLEIIESVDGPIAMNTCSYSKSNCFSAQGTKCPLHDIWSQSQSDLVNRLSSTSFGQLVNNNAM